MFVIGPYNEHYNSYTTTMGKDEQSFYDGELTTLMQEVRKLYELKLRNNTSNHSGKIDRLEKRLNRLEEQFKKLIEQFNLTNQAG